MANRTPPWPVYPKWTTARYWQFLRSGLRSLSRKWPPIYEAQYNARRAYKGANKAQKWEYQCGVCHGWFKGVDVSVDHIIPAGELKAYGDVVPFVERLFCPASGLQCICKLCHDTKTTEERNARKRQRDEP